MRETALNQLWVHPQNEPYANIVIAIAKRHGYQVRHNASTIAGFYGHHRYVVLKPGATNYTIKSRDVVDYTEAPYSHYFKPSIKGERIALTKLAFSLRGEPEF